MRHVTVTNKPDNPIFKLMTDVVNLGERFPSVELGHDKGMGYKIILLKIFLDELADDELVLFTDAHDVHLSGSHKEIEEKFLEFGSDIVFAAEKNCWPVKAMETQYHTYHDRYLKYKYLNSGAFIGRVGPLKKFINKNFHTVSGGTDDQTYYTQLYLAHQTQRNLVRLDTRCEIFQCLFLASFDIDEDRCTNRVTGTRPLVWHSNGALTEFFVKKLCGLPDYTPRVKLEIDQQLIAPNKNVICLTDQTDISVNFFKIFPTNRADEVYRNYPGHWVALVGPGVKLPDMFEYRIYGRVLDTRKLYLLLKPDNTMEEFYLFFEKRNPEDFFRAGLVEAL